MTIRRKQTDRRHLAHRDIPGGKHAVDRLGSTARPSYFGEAGGDVDRVVHFARPVGIACQGHHDHVVAAGFQRLVGQLAAHRKVGEENAPVGARTRDECCDQFLPLGRAQIDLDRTLALVHAGPEQAAAVVGQGPAAIVEAAADLVVADDIGAELGERHPAERRRHEGRSLDDAEPCEDAAGHAKRPVSRQSRTSETLPSTSVARTCDRRCTRPPPPGSGSQRFD